MIMMMRQQWALPLLMALTFLLSTYYIYQSRSKSTRLEGSSEERATEVGKISENFTFKPVPHNFSTIYERRRETLQKSCLKYQDDPLFQRYNSRNHHMKRRLYFDTRHGFMFCGIPKSGSTTWSEHLAKLAGITNMHQKRNAIMAKEFGPANNAEKSRQPEDDNLRQALRRKTYTLPADWSMADARSRLVSVAFVREPFDRLVSGYNQKIARPRHQSLVHIWLDVIQRFRGEEKFWLVKKHPTPEEFVRYVIDVCKHNSLLNSGACNSHFRPQYIICPFCYLGLTFMGKTETFTRDTKVIATELNFKKHIAVETQANQHSRHIPGKDKTRIFFKDVPRQLIKELYEQVYKWDYEMFGFEKPDFRRLGSEN